MSATISQLSSFTSLRRNLLLRRRSTSSFTIRFKCPVIMSLQGHDSETSSSRDLPNLSYTADSRSSVQGMAKSSSVVEEHLDGTIGTNGPVNPSVNEPRRAAKIHDFCFGIPFGGFVLTGGLLGFIFSRDLAALSSGTLFGGALLALSSISLKVWRHGKSSFPFILGQAALSAALFWKNFQSYSLTKKIFPSGLYAVISAGMLFFYSYVVISGGNPPPKKLKSTANIVTS